jgi:predicted RNA-binding Zn ribbon-like protein
MVWVFYSREINDMARVADAPVSLVLRLPPKLHRQLTREAGRKGQSLNNEMVGRLEESLHHPRLDLLVDAVRRYASDASDAAFSAVLALGADEPARQELMDTTKHLREVLDQLWEFRKGGQLELGSVNPAHDLVEKDK